MSVFNNRVLECSIFIESNVYLKLLIHMYGYQVMLELCLKFLDVFGISADWALGAMVTILDVKDDVINCFCYSVLKRGDVHILTKAVEL